jgi:tetratricopeptide (TPR) repeat protein
VLSDLGRHGEALGVLKPLIETDPALPGPWQQYGIALHRAGQCREAATAFRRALGLDPGLAETWCNLAAALLGCGEPQGAREAAERALDLAPDLPRAWQALGAARLKDGDLQGAVEACRRFAELGPDDPDAWGDLALALRGAGRFEEAIDACDRGLRVRPDSPQLLATRASARWESGAAAESAADCERAIAIDSQDPDTWNSLGIARHLLRDLPGAQSAYGQALRLDPGHAAAHMNLALVLLARGEYERGWAEYEWRWEGSRGGLAGRRDLPLPQWRGEPLRGEAILLHTEQGLGDAIQFARYVPLVAERGGRAILECYPELVRLFSRLPGVERVVPTGSLGPEGLGAIAWHCPLMSLPLAFGTRVETIPADLPYLSPDPADRSRWAQRLARLAGAKVGLVWAGNPRPEDPVNHRIDRRRSLALGQLAPLLATPGIAFVSLQKGPPAAQAQGTGLLDWGGELGDFAVTAALVANLDLVISVDTSVAHLAGALGRPVWLLSRHDACWRWLEGRDDSPWYPGMRIFRQQAPGDWPSAIDPLAAALADWAAQRRG